MEKLHLELVAVEQDSDRTVFTFLDRERGEVRDVKWNTKKYEDEKWVQSDEQEEKIERWSQEIFGLSYNQLPSVANDGLKKDVYVYDKFNSLFETRVVSKFDKDMVGQIMSVAVKSVTTDDVGIHIGFEYEGEDYESKMSWSNYVESEKKFFIDPHKKQKKIDEFESKFHIPFEDREQLVGTDVMVEIKLAFKKWTYVDIKPLPPKKG